MPEEYMEREDLKLLKKYLNGDTTPAENRYIRSILVHQLAEKDDSVKQLLLKEWKQTSAENELGLDLDEAWNEFMQKMLIHTGQTGQHVKMGRPGQLSGWMPVALVAASIILVLASAVVFSYFKGIHSQSAPAEVAYTTKKTNRGEKLNISLPDGSFIKLNYSTRLRIPSNYTTADERIVYLEGEAFFEIAKYQGRPFKVISGEVTTEVLGTSFNVNTFSPNKDVSVSVVEGKVRVANHNQEIVLASQEMTKVGPATEVFTKNAFDEELITGWRNNILIFDRVSFNEIIEKLRLWYGVEFEIRGGIPPAGKYSGRFENESLPLVLEGLGFSSAFEYKIVDKIVYLNF